MKQFRKWSSGTDETVSFLIIGNRWNCYTFWTGLNETVSIFTKVPIKLFHFPDRSQWNYSPKPIWKVKQFDWDLGENWNCFIKTGPEGVTVSLGPFQNMEKFHLLPVWVGIKNETVSSVPLDYFGNCFIQPPPIYAAINFEIFLRFNWAV